MERTMNPVNTNRPTKATVRKNRLLFIAGAILVLGIGGMFAYETERALYVRSVTGSVFANYVIQHDVGRAAISDDASGFQGDFCVLTLNRPIPAKRLQAETTALAWQYYNLDGGTNLTIQYDDAATHRAIVQCTTAYTVGPNILNMNLRFASRTKQISVKENWPSADGSEG